MKTRFISRILDLTLISIKEAKQIENDHDYKKVKTTVSIEIYEYQKTALFWLAKHHKEAGIGPYLRKVGIPKLLKIEEQEVSP